jgi:hypothetical protein
VFISSIVVTGNKLLLVSLTLVIKPLMRASTLRWQVGWGWALEFETFLGPVKWHFSRWENAICGPKKSKFTTKILGSGSGVGDADAQS